MVNSPCQHNLLQRPPPRATLAFGLKQDKCREVSCFPLPGTAADRHHQCQTPSSTLLHSRNHIYPTAPGLCSHLPTSHTRCSQLGHCLRCCQWLQGQREVRAQAAQCVLCPAQPQPRPTAPLQPCNHIQLFGGKRLCWDLSQSIVPYNILKALGFWYRGQGMLEFGILPLPQSTTAKNASEDFLLEVRAVDSHSNYLWKYGIWLDFFLKVNPCLARASLAKAGTAMYWPRL